MTTREEQNLLSIIRAWNPAVANQMSGCLAKRNSEYDSLRRRNLDLTTTLTSLLVEAKNLYDHRPATALRRIDRCLTVLSTTK